MLWDPPWGAWGGISTPEGGGLVPKGLRGPGRGDTPGTVAPVSPQPLTPLSSADLCKNCHHLIAHHEYTFSVVDDYQVRPGERLVPRAAPLQLQGRPEPSPGLLLCLRVSRPSLPWASLLIPGSRRREPGSFGGEPWGQPGRFQSRIAVLGDYLEPPDTSPRLVGGSPARLSPPAQPLRGNGSDVRGPEQHTAAAWWRALQLSQPSSLAHSLFSS